MCGEEQPGKEKFKKFLCLGLPRVVVFDGVDDGVALQLEVDQLESG